MIGHPLAGANGIELAMGALIFERNVLPPTINQEFPDPQCDLDYIPNKARQKKINCMLKTSSGFSESIRRWCYGDSRDRFVACVMR